MCIVRVLITIVSLLLTLVRVLVSIVRVLIALPTSPISLSKYLNVPDVTAPGVCPSTRLGARLGARVRASGKSLGDL